MEEDQVQNAGDTQAQPESHTEENHESESESQETVSTEQSAQDDTGNSQEETEDINNHKPTRESKRVKDLIGKLKGKQEPQPQRQPDYNPFQQDPFANLQGEITPDQLRGLIAQEADRIAQTRIAQADQYNRYQRAVDEHVSDLEATANEIEKDFANDPKTAKEINEMLVTLNERANIDNGRLVPRVKTSELYAQIKRTLNRERLNGQADVTPSMASRMANQSPKPKVVTKDEPSTDDLRANLWKNPGAVRKELEKRLPHS